MSYSFVAVAHFHHRMAVFPVTPAISFFSKRRPKFLLEFEYTLDHVLLDSKYVKKNTIKKQEKNISI